MKRRSGAGGKLKGRKRSTPKRRNAPKATRNRGAPIAGQETVVARLTRERDEALLRETANSEILRLIPRSPGDLETVFRSILVNANRICEAHFGTIFRYDGKALVVTAWEGVPPEYLALLQSGPLPVNERTATGRAAKSKQVVHIADLSAEPRRTKGDQLRARLVELGGVRTILAVPMLRDGELTGAISIFRREVRPFTDKQIELVKNFAAQAVIAIENTRLLNELRQSLEQQTATSDVLRVISASPGELEPVFQAMLENATRICEAKFGSLFEFADGAFRALSNLNTPPALIDFNRKLRVWGPHTALGRLAHTRQTVHVEDALADRAYREDTSRKAAVQLGGIRTLLAVPMLKEDVLVGAITIFRQEVRPFTEKQIALVTNFAAQAVIAIENARLLNELRERTEEVVKLNQQLEQRVADQVGEIERMGRLRRFLPPQVADLIVASGTEKQLESHRREITALFCDLRGFTGFSESSDPEDVMALLRDYHAAIGEIIIKYSGTLERFAGDGVMVIFNDPVPVENPALQAVLMALDMRTAIGGMIEKWRDLGHDLGFGIGIAHGFATLGTIGFEGRFDYAAIGTVSNVASRLCDEAKPGQILISPRVRLAVDKVVTVETVGEFTLKGIRRPMMTYNVLSSLGAKPN